MSFKKYKIGDLKLKNGTQRIILVLFLVLFYSSQNLFAFFDSKKDATFEVLYPVPFYETTTGKIIVDGGLLAVEIGITVATDGFGMPLAMAIATSVGSEAVIRMLPENKYKGNYKYIELELPETGGKRYKEELENLKRIDKKYLNKELTYEEYEEEKRKKYKQILNIIETITDSDYDLINRAILQFNLHKYKESRKSINEAKKSFDKKSYIYYHLALLDLVDGDYNSAIVNLENSLKDEQSLKPYLLYTMIYEDLGKKDKALEIVKKGLEEYDDDSFELNDKAGDYEFENKHYKKALKYYQNALRNVTVNKIEAIEKIKIANCYYKLNDNKQFFWYAYDALDEVDDNKDYQQKLMRLLIVELKEKAENDSSI